MLLKLTASKINVTLSLICHFLNANCTSEPSNIYYLNIVSENADDDTTILKLSEELIVLFEKRAKQDWILLTGDSKTYQHLMSIKNILGATQKIAGFSW